MLRTIYEYGEECSVILRRGAYYIKPYSYFNDGTTYNLAARLSYRTKVVTIHNLSMRSVPCYYLPFKIEEYTIKAYAN